MGTQRLWWCALFGVALLVPARGQWERAVWSGKGTFKDAPAPHPLGYFTENPFLRDDGDELCRLCTPAGKARSAEQYSIRSVVKPVGALAGFNIVDVLYYVRERQNPAPFASGDPANWKSILVQVGPDAYKEIFHLQAYYTTASLAPSQIVQSGNERVLATMDPDGGNGGGCWEGYWWFDSSGPHALDFSRLEAAVKSRIPENASLQMSCSHLDLSREQIRSWVQKSSARCRACDGLGDVTVCFHLDGRVAEPVGVEFKPSNPER